MIAQSANIAKVNKSESVAFIKECESLIATNPDITPDISRVISDSSSIPLREFSRRDDIIAIIRPITSTVARLIAVAVIILFAGDGTLYLLFIKKSPEYLFSKGYSGAFSIMTEKISFLPWFLQSLQSLRSLQSPLPSREPSLRSWSRLP